jgi:hypothetical protein
MSNFIEIAAKAAVKLAQKYSGKPELEFVSWLQIALEREAMVTKTYDDEFVGDQLASWQQQQKIPESIIKAIRKALMNVWAQEKSHQAYFEAFLEEVCPPSTKIERLLVRLKEYRGELQGQLLGASMSDSRLAQIAIVLGSTIYEVPEYVQGLREIAFAEFCTINGDLEHTAVIGYERMVELARSLPKSSTIIRGTTALVDLKRTGKDERYHEVLFRELANWPPPPPGGPTSQISPLGPASISQTVITADDAYAMIAKAQTIAYGADGEASGNTVLEFDRGAMARDPLVLQLRSLIEEAANEEEEGNTRYMTAGA